MEEGNIIRDQSKAHFITPTVVDWIDVFANKPSRDCVTKSLSYCIKNKGMVLHAYVIMSNHMHMVVQSSNGDLSGLINDFKRYVAKTIVKDLKADHGSRSEWMLARFKLAAQGNPVNKKHQFWQYGNHPEEICSDRFMRTKLHYIHQNPVRAGIVSRDSDYVYSSASNYAYGSGVVENIELYAKGLKNNLRSSTSHRQETI